MCQIRIAQSNCLQRGIKMKMRSVYETKTHNIYPSRTFAA